MRHSAVELMKIRPAIIGPFGPPQLACLRSWKARGYEPVFVHLSGQKGTRILRRYVKDYLHVTPVELQKPIGAKRIAGFLQDANATGITCVSESTARWLFSVRESMPKDLGYWFASLEAINLLASKAAQLELAGTAGFKILPTYFMEKQEPGSAPLAFPIVARPDGPDGCVPSFKVELIDSPRSFRLFQQRFQTIHKPLLLQPLVSGPNIVIHGWRSRVDKQSGFCGFLVEQKYQGVTLTMKKIDLPLEIVQACRKFCDQLDIFGCFHFELIRCPDTQEWFFLEINGRFGGTTAKALKLGFDEPYALLHAFGVEGAEETPECQQSNDIASNRRAMLKFVVSTLRGTTSDLDHPGMTSAAAIKKVLAGSVGWKDEVFSIHDLRGYLAYEAQQIADKVFT